MFSHVKYGTHWFLPKAEIPVPLSILRARYSVQPKFDNPEIPTYIEDAEYFGVPRYHTNLGELSDVIVDESSEGLPTIFNMRSSLRERQKPVFNEFVNLVNKDVHGFQITAPTGSGKTVITLNYIQHLAKTTLVVVPREHIVTQWKDRILEHTDITEDEIGIAQGDKCQFEGKKIVIGMMHSLAKDKYPKEFLNYFGVIAFDECHTLATEHFSTVMGLFPAKYRIGMSATPDRKDGATDVIRWHLCEKNIVLEGGVEAIPTVVIKRYKAADTKHPYLATLNDVVKRRGIILTMLAKDMTRTNLISQYVHKFVESGRRTVVLSDRKEQLKTIQAILVQRMGYNAQDVGLFIQETKKAERKRVLDNCKVILATYGVMNMAIDVPDLRGLIYGTPLSDPEQAAGRISRLSSESKDPFILDIVDEAFADCERWASSRAVIYNKLQSVIHEVK